jgi:F0F1-type ATP synthase, subunit b
MEFLRDPETWIAAAFIVFIVAAGRPILRAMNKGLDERGARIKANLDEARRLREEAEALLAEYLAKQRARPRRRPNAGPCPPGGRDPEEGSGRQSGAMLKRRERMALDKIAQAEAKALAEVRAEAVDVAVAAATRILTRHLAQERAGALIDQAIGELDKKLH